MIKFLLVVVVIVVVLALMFARRREPKSPQRSSEVEGMVRCAHCGVHLPRSEAVLSRGRTYCSAAHLELDRREP
jgi:uncharacterized protein